MMATALAGRGDHVVSGEALGRREQVSAGDQQPRTRPACAGLEIQSRFSERVTGSQTGSLVRSRSWIVDGHLCSAPGP